MKLYFGCVVDTHRTRQLYEKNVKRCLNLFNSSVCMCKAYNFDQLRNGDLKLHCDRVGDILHWSDELVISSEQLPEQSILCLG